jgi:hypothetical protein
LPPPRRASPLEPVPGGARRREDDPREPTQAGWWLSAVESARRTSPESALHARSRMLRMAFAKLVYSRASEERVWRRSDPSCVWSPCAR